MGVIRSKDWPLADRERAWDAAAARDRIARWAGGPEKGNVDWGKYRQCFLYVDEEAGEENFTSYRFPYVDIIDGGPKVVFRAIAAIIAVLNGGRGGANISEDDRQGVYREAARQYRRFDEEPPPLRSDIPALEYRSFPFLPEVETRDGEKPRIVGYAAVFDTPSEPLGGFREIIRRGAFSRAIREGDVRALWNHDPRYVLGRTKSGTLFLREDIHGLRVEIDPPDTQWARDFMESIRRGDVDQMSFAFRALQDRWLTDDSGAVRELLEVDLYDVSPVTFPAYPTTAVAVRSEPVDLLRPSGVDEQVRVRLENLRRRLQLLERMR